MIIINVKVPETMSNIHIFSADKQAKCWEIIPGCTRHYGNPYEYTDILFLELHTEGRLRGCCLRTNTPVSICFISFPPLNHCSLKVIKRQIILFNIDVAVGQRIQA